MNMMKIPRSTFLEVFPSILQLFQVRHYPSNLMKQLEERRQKEIARIKSKISIDNPPTFCCGMGCQDCIYIIWAEALVEKMDVEGPSIVSKVMKMVQDENLKAFLAHEFRVRGFIKK